MGKLAFLLAHSELAKRDSVLYDYHRPTSELYWKLSHSGTHIDVRSENNGFCRPFELKKSFVIQQTAEIPAEKFSQTGYSGGVAANKNVRHCWMK